MSDIVAYFDRTAPIWTGKYARSRFFRARLETVVEWVQDAPPGSRILDYGCGSGVILKVLMERGYDMTGTDISSAMIEQAQANLAGSPGKARLELLSGEEDGSYLGRIYDGIISLGVIEYLETPETLLAKLASVLKPSGFLILSFPNRLSLLGGVEKWIFRHPTLFKAFNLWPHLTGEDSYLNFQRCKFSLGEMDAILRVHGLARKRSLVHVAPEILGAFEKNQRIGMSVMAQYVKHGRA